MKPEGRLLSEILLRRLEVIRLKISRQTLGILDLGIEVIGSNADELGAEIGEKHLIVTVGRFRRADRIVILHPTLYLERSAFLRASEFAQGFFVAAVIDATSSKSTEQPFPPFQLEEQPQKGGGPYVI